MAIRYVSFTVSQDTTVTPTIPQYGGVQGEHKATEVAFIIDASGMLANPNYTYYIECVDAAGGYDRTAAITLRGNTLSTLVPLAWTQYGGISTLRLVAEEDGIIIYSVEGRLQFEDRQTAMEQVDGLLRTDIRQTLDACHQAAQDTAQTATACAESAAACEQTLADCREEAAEAAALNDKTRSAIDALPRLGTDIADNVLWTGKHTVDTLCTPIEERGSMVVCHPVAGYPMSVTVERPSLISLDYAPTGTYTDGGITYTRGADGCIIVNGTATATSFYRLFDQAENLNPIAAADIPLGGSVRLYGAPAGGSQDSYYLYYHTLVTMAPTTGAVQYIRFDTGEGITFPTMNEDYADTHYHGCGICIQKGTVCNNLVFRPRLEPVEEVTLTVREGGKLTDRTLTNAIPHILTAAGGKTVYEVNSDNAVTVRGREDIQYTYGNTEEALDSILAIQQTLIGGESA